MRPVQQNRRMRGRGNNNNNNNNRKGPNPLSRNYESNGPDVKIRGNAQHVAEKYMTLARDAQASGDRVIAENYLQHAEHYNRIVMAAMAQQNIPYQREDHFDNDVGDDEESGNTVVHVHQPVDGTGPQPEIEGTPAEVVYGEDHGEAIKSNEANAQPREPREPREQRERRLPRGRRPHRERFNNDAAVEKVADEAPAVMVEVQETVQPKEQAAPVAVEVTAAPEVAAPEASAVEAVSEVAAPRRTTRRPGRPRRVVKDEEATDAPATEAANTDS